MLKFFPLLGISRGRAGKTSAAVFPAVPHGRPGRAVAHHRCAKSNYKIMSTNMAGKKTDLLCLELFSDKEIMSTITEPEQASDSPEEKLFDSPEEKRLRQLRRLAGRLLDRLEEAIEGEDFSPKELRAYTNTLMDLREIQMIDPEKLAAENELKLRRMRRDAGDVQARELRISFSEAAADAAE